jgi:hypothetical protein
MIVVGREAEGLECLERGKGRGATTRTTRWATTRRTPRWVIRFYPARETEIGMGMGMGMWMGMMV